MGLAITWLMLARPPVAKAATTITVTSAADAGGTCPGANCTLRQAIVTAISGDTINFAQGITTINLTTAELLITKNLTINGPGANLLTVQRSIVGPGIPNFRIFHIAIAENLINVTLSGLTISNGIAPANESGGGILSETNTVTIANSTISGNTASSGGGIYLQHSDGSANIINSTISGNKANNGGGILGTVSKVVSPEEIEIDIAPGVRVKVLRSTIASVLAKPDPAAAREAAKEKEGARREADKA